MTILEGFFWAMNLFGFFGLVIYVNSIVVIVRQSRKHTSRFKMFAARDQLVLLVADGTLEESNPAWKLEYVLINDVLGIHQKLNRFDLLWSVAKFRVAKENNEELNRRCEELDQCLVQESKRTPALAKVMQEADEGFRHLVHTRTQWWHRIALLLFGLLSLCAVSVRLRGRPRNARKALKGADVSSGEAACWSSIACC